MAFHELGHVSAAVASGGGVKRVVLHPMTISQTDVYPNPSPGRVVWAGPLMGCLIPLVIAVAMPSNRLTVSKLARFFAGFCLIANGAYIGIGAFYRVGDCAEMLRTGSPHWVLVLFGA